MKPRMEKVNLFSIYLSVYPSIHPSTHPSIHWTIVYLSTNLSTHHLPNHHLPIHLPTHSIHPLIHHTHSLAYPIHPYTYPSAHPSITLPTSTLIHSLIQYFIMLYAMGAQVNTEFHLQALLLYLTTQNVSIQAGKGQYNTNNKNGMLSAQERDI